jgi:hypothetical protein
MAARSSCLGPCLRRSGRRNQHHGADQTPGERRLDYSRVQRSHRRQPSRPAGVWRRMVGLVDGAGVCAGHPPSTVSTDRGHNLHLEARA